MGDDIRHMGAAEGIEQEDGGDDHQRWSQCPPCCLKQQHHTDDGDHDIHLGRGAGTACELGIEQIDIGCSKAARQCKDPVYEWDPIPRRMLQGWVGGKMRGKSQTPSE